MGIKWFNMIAPISKRPYKKAVLTCDRKYCLASARVEEKDQDECHSDIAALGWVFDGENWSCPKHGKEATSVRT